MLIDAHATQANKTTTLVQVLKNKKNKLYFK